MSVALESLLGTWRPGRSLVREFYVSPAVFEADLEHVFFRHWLFVGHASRLARPGDYFLYEIGGESVILVRGEGGEIFGLVNVCTHRGSRLCLVAEGHAAKFVCPYHAWCFDLDGRFVSARQLPPDVGTAELALTRCRVLVVEDLVFICLAPAAPDFRRVVENLRRYFRPHGLAQARIAARRKYLLKANWKVAAENFFECYHCLPAHPELTQVMSYVRAFDSPRHAAERLEYTARWEARAKALGHLTGSEKSEDGVAPNVCRIPIREGFLTQSRDGQPVAPLMGEFKEYDGGVTGMQFFPLTWFAAANDYVMLARFTPLAVQRTEVEVTWLVHQDAVEGRDYQTDSVTWLWHHTMIEDRKITEDNQAGINSRFYRPGPHARDEAPVDEFLAWYIAQLRQPIARTDRHD